MEPYLVSSEKNKPGFCHWNVRFVGWGCRGDVMYFIHGSFTLIPPWLTESKLWVSSFWWPEGYITVQAGRHYVWCVILHVIEFLLENPPQTFCHDLSGLTDFRAHLHLRGPVYHVWKPNNWNRQHFIRLPFQGLLDWFNERNLYRESTYEEGI